MRRVLLTILSLLVFVAGAVAGGRGGHNTTWDPNLFGGDWSCFGPQTTGCARGFDAQCAGGATGDPTAAFNWISYGISQGGTQAKLYVPPGSQCGTFNSLTWGGSEGAGAIQNSIVWGYGAKVTTSSGYIVARGAFLDSSHDASILSVSAGANTVTLVNAGDASIFSVGDAIMVGGLELQTCCGFPWNFQFYEFGSITAITGTTTIVITLGAPLKNTYLSTWPLIEAASGIFNGPAKIFKLQPSWNLNTAIYGLTIDAVTFPSSQDLLQGRNIQITDSLFLTENTSIGQNQNIWLMFTSVQGHEVDKLVESANWYRALIRSNMTFQSPVPTTGTVASTTILGAMVGTPNDLTVIGSRVPFAIMGTTGYGVNTRAAFDGTFIGGADQSSATYVQTPDVTLTAGTWSIGKSDPDAFQFVRWAVPNKKYYYAGNSCFNNSSPFTTFTITAVREDATHYFADTDIVGTPAPTCSLVPCPFLCPFAALTITQKNSPAGSVSVTGFAAP